MRVLSILLLVACGPDPMLEPRDTPREIPPVPESVRPAIEAAQARSASAAAVQPTSESVSSSERAAAERAALDQVSMADLLPAPPGRIHLLAPTDVQGRFNPESLRTVMGPRVEELERCYTEVLREDRHAVGRVVARWTVSGGRVTEVSIVPGAVENEAVHTCLSEWLRSLRIRAAGTVVLTQPFLFHQAS